MAVDPLIAAALVASAFVQGLSGVGFSLIAAPAITQSIPGAGAIGLVNLLALSQNSMMLWREPGSIQWSIVRRLLPGLLLGVALGLIVSSQLGVMWRPAVVAASSLASLCVLLWREAGRRRWAAFVLTTWSGAVNSYGGVGGPPLAAYLVHLDLDEHDYIRTLQLCFALLNIVSLPFLRLPSVTVAWVLVAMCFVVVGTTLGRFARRFLPTDHARSVSVAVIALVATVALVCSIVSLVA